MRAVHLYQRAGPNRVRVEEHAQPAPQADEVLIRVHAAAVTPTELQWMPTWTTRTGQARPLPVIPGHEFSGVVAAVGHQVASLAVGDAVYGLNDWFGDGAQAHYCIVRPSDVALKPSTVDHVQSAMIPISALTAWQGLFDRARLTAGQRVLVHGAAGAVGCCAVQLAHRKGAYVIGTSSAHNLDFVRSLGSEQVIDYRATRFEDVVRDMDIVFDTVGGDTLARSWQVLKPTGRLVTIAASEEGATDSRGHEAFLLVEGNKAQLTEIACLIDQGQLLPIVDTVYPLAQASEAYEHKTLRGKTVLRVIE
jgi:NADPH:quinone reductase-like Zn-dependent oxidoreductase